MSEFDICVRSARLRHMGDDLFQIAIRAGEIVEIAEEVKGKGDIELDAGGGLVTWLCCSKINCLTRCAIMPSRTT